MPSTGQDAFLERLLAHRQPVKSAFDELVDVAGAEIAAFGQNFKNLVERGRRAADLGRQFQ